MSCAFMKLLISVSIQRYVTQTERKQKVPGACLSSEYMRDVCFFLLCLDKLMRMHQRGGRMRRFIALSVT